MEAWWRPVTVFNGPAGIGIELVDIFLVLKGLVGMYRLLSGCYWLCLQWDIYCVVRGNKEISCFALGSQWRWWQSSSVHDINPSIFEWTDSELAQMSVYKATMSYLVNLYHNYLEDWHLEVGGNNLNYFSLCLLVDNLWVIPLFKSKQSIMMKISGYLM